MSLTWQSRVGGGIGTALSAESADSADSATRSGFRIERFDVGGPSLARLVDLGSSGERASAWVAVEPGDSVDLDVLGGPKADRDSGSEGALLILSTAASQRRLPLPAPAAAYRIRADAPVRVRAIAPAP
jgi:hypothetical protein